MAGLKQKQIMMESRIVSPNAVSDIPVLEKSDINQAYRSGLGSEFIWMHLNKSPSIISYTPPENNAMDLSLEPIKT